MNIWRPGWLVGLTDLLMCLAAGWLAFLAAIRTLDALAPIQHSGSSPAVELALLATAAVALAACGVATIRWLA